MKAKKRFGIAFFMSAIFFVLISISSCGDDEIITPPTANADFIFDATTDIIGQAPLNVSFVNNSTNAVSHAWDFGDGSSSSDVSPTYVYANGGTYTVSLTVTNSEGVSDVDQADIVLDSPLEGRWVLDSSAVSTVDTLTVLGAMEAGVSQVDGNCPSTGFDGSDFTGWDGTEWQNIFTDDNPYGHSTFWSGVIFAGNYFGRTDFFENEFTFSNDGTYEVDLKGELRLPDFIVAAEADFLETDNWINSDGVDVNAWKSSTDYTFDVTNSSKFPGHGELTLNGEGAFLGVYFAGVTGEGTYKIPQSEYKFVISSVSADELIIFGFTSNLICVSDLMILKFTKAN